MGDGFGVVAGVAGGCRGYGQPLLLEEFDGAGQVPGLARKRDFGDAVLFEHLGRVGSVFCGVVGLVFNPDGFGMKTLFQGFGHRIGLRAATVGGATDHEDGFTGLLLQVGTIAQALQGPFVDGIGASVFGGAVVFAAAEYDDGLDAVELRLGNGRAGFQAVQQGIAGSRQAEDDQARQRKGGEHTARLRMFSGEQKPKKGQQYQAGGRQNERAENLFEQEGC